MTKYLSKSEAQILQHMLTAQGNYVSKVEMQSVNKYVVVVTAKKD